MERNPESRTTEPTESNPASTCPDLVATDMRAERRNIRRPSKAVTSETKIASNRRNASKSSGPRTKRGKKHSSFNALRFGLYAGPQVLPGESFAEHRALLLKLEKNLKPQGPIEEMYVTQIQRGMWRLKRADVAEHAFITTQLIAFAEKMGDRNSEVLRMIALGPVLSGIVNQPFDGMDDRVSRLRKQIIAEIKENLQALGDCQRSRSMDVQAHLTDRPWREPDGRRRLMGSTRPSASQTGQIPYERQSDVN